MNGAALFPDMGTFAPPSPLVKNVPCVGETEIPVEQQPPRGIFVCDHAGLVINTSSPGQNTIKHGVGYASGFSGVEFRVHGCSVRAQSPTLWVLSLEIWVSGLRCRDSGARGLAFEFGDLGCGKTFLVRAIEGLEFLPSRYHTRSV